MTPLAGVESHKHLLVLLAEPARLPAAPAAVEPAPPQGRSPVSTPGVRGWLRDTFALRSSQPRDLSGTRLGTRPHYLLRPANPLFIWGSLVVALLLNLFPWGQLPFVPDWLAVALLFWNVAPAAARRHRRVLRVRPADGRAQRCAVSVSTPLPTR